MNICVDPQKFKPDRIQAPSVCLARAGLPARSPFVTTCGVTSILLFVASLTQDCFFIDRLENPRAWSNGFGLLAVGWLGVFTGVYSWLANPTLLIAWLAMWSPYHKRYSIGASAIQTLILFSHNWFVLISRFKIVTSFRMHATIATFDALPCALRCV